MHPHVFKSNTHHFPLPRTASQRSRKPGAFRRWLRTAFHHWQRRKMIETLRGMDDRLLRDIGIDRSDIPRVVDGLADRELSMRPVSSDVQVDARWRGGRTA
ncbi:MULTISPECIES: DUF1127 domain-containing protein [Mameliella]|uniref:DUF1127 domain-containing protein n=1 Tax=Mameliella TaxID=1434019 RepID=UPI001CC1A7FC|nr:MULTISPECIES: DUF1127 domain-containing protein [Mameliella]